MLMSKKVRRAYELAKEDTEFHAAYDNKSKDALEFNITCRDTVMIIVACYWGYLIGKNDTHTINYLNSLGE